MSVGAAVGIFSGLAWKCITPLPRRLVNYGEKEELRKKLREVEVSSCANACLSIPWIFGNNQKYGVVIMQCQVEKEFRWKHIFNQRKICVFLRKQYLYAQYSLMFNFKYKTHLHSYWMQGFNLFKQTIKRIMQMLKATLFGN